MNGGKIQWSDWLGILGLAIVVVGLLVSPLVYLALTTGYQTPHADKGNYTFYDGGPTHCPSNTTIEFQRVENQTWVTNERRTLTNGTVNLTGLPTGERYRVLAEYNRTRAILGVLWYDGNDSTIYIRECPRPS
jgi:prepilin-type processing-associated H-X9-DG protein